MNPPRNSNEAERLRQLTEDLSIKSRETILKLNAVAETVSRKDGASLLAWSGIMLGGITISMRYASSILDFGSVMETEEFFSLMYLAAFMIFSAAGIRVWMYAKWLEIAKTVESPDDTKYSHGSDD